MKIHTFAYLTLLLLLCAGCSVNLSHAPEQPIQKNAGELVKSLPIGQTLAGKIPSQSKVAVRSMELDETLDLPMIALIEDQIIQSLKKQGFSVLERDQNTLKQMIKEGNSNSLDLCLPANQPLVQTQLASVDYILSYRLISFDLWHEMESTGCLRNSNLEVNYRILDAKSGKIIYADTCQVQHSDFAKNDPHNKDYHYALFPHEIKPTLDKVPLVRLISETIPNNSKITLQYIEADETGDIPLNAIIEDQIVMALLEDEYLLYERDGNSLRQLVQENTGNGFRLLMNDGSGVFDTGLYSTDYILSYRIGEVNIRHEALIGTLEIYRHGLLSLHLRVEKALTGEIIKAADLLGTSSYRLPNPVLSQLRDYRYIKFTPSVNPLDPKGRYFSERVSRPDLENRKRFLFRPSVNLVRTNDHYIIGESIDYGVNFARHHELYLSSSLAGISTDYGFAYHGVNYGLEARNRNITFNPFIGVGRADATYVIFDYAGFPIGMLTQLNYGLRYGVFLEYHIKANSIGIGFQGIWTESERTRASLLSCGFRF